MSRIHGDASFCVELLTSQDNDRCNLLAEEAELANTRRKSLQKDTIKQVTKKLEQLDLSTTSVIVLEDRQWQGGVLGLAAGQIAQEYGRPTVLLSSGGSQDGEETMARGSARSINGIDLYQLVKSQSDLLHRFGGHPFAAGLSMPLDNLGLFREGMNQQLRQGNIADLMPQVKIDLVVTVADLGRDLFEELRLLEPYGMGNPIPKLLVKNCWFKNVWNQNIQDKRGRKVQYIKTSFNILDDTVKQGFSGLWWGHYKDEIPVTGRCDAIAELDFNTFSKRYEIRLISLKPSEEANLDAAAEATNRLIDRRKNPQQLELEILDSQANLLQQCPDSWNDIHREYRRAIHSDRSLVLAYQPDRSEDLNRVWLELLGIAKYLVRTQKQVTKQQIKDKLRLSDLSFAVGLAALQLSGFEHTDRDSCYQFSYSAREPDNELSVRLKLFLNIIEEEYFQQHYFHRVELATIERQLRSE